MTVRNGAVQSSISDTLLATPEQIFVVSATLPGTSVCAAVLTQVGIINATLSGSSTFFANGFVPELGAYEPKSFYDVLPYVTDSLHQPIPDTEIVAGATQWQGNATLNGASTLGAYAYQYDTTDVQSGPFSFCELVPTVTVWDEIPIGVSELGSGATTWQANAEFDGAGGLAPYLTEVNLGNATLPGASNLSAFLTEVNLGNATLPGTSTFLAIEGVQFNTLIAEFDGAGNLAAFLTEVNLGNATLPGTSTFLAVEGVQFNTLIAEFDGAGGLAAYTPQYWQDTGTFALLSGASTFFADGSTSATDLPQGIASDVEIEDIVTDSLSQEIAPSEIVTVWQDIATLPGTSTFLAVEGVQFNTLIAEFDGAGNLAGYTPQYWQDTQTGATLPGSSTFLAVEGVQFNTLIAEFDGAGGLAPYLTEVNLANATLPGTSTFLAVEGVQFNTLTAEFDGAGGLSGYTPQYWQDTGTFALLSGSSTFLAGANTQSTDLPQGISSEVEIEDIVTDSLSQEIAPSEIVTIWQVTAEFDGAGNLFANINKLGTQFATAELDGAGNLAAFLTERAMINATLSGSSTFLAVPYKAAVEDARGPLSFSELVPVVTDSLSQPLPVAEISNLQITATLPGSSSAAAFLTERAIINATLPGSSNFSAIPFGGVVTVDAPNTFVSFCEAVPVVTDSLSQPLPIAELFKPITATLPGSSNFSAICVPGATTSDVPNCLLSFCELVGVFSGVRLVSPDGAPKESSYTIGATLQGSGSLLAMYQTSNVPARGILTSFLEAVPPVTDSLLQVLPIGGLPTVWQDSAVLGGSGQFSAFCLPAPDAVTGPRSFYDVSYIVTESYQQPLPLAVQVAANVWQATAEFDGASSLAAFLTERAMITATLPGSSTFGAYATQLGTQFATAEFDGAGNLSAYLTERAMITATLPGAGSLSGYTPQYWRDTQTGATLPGIGSLYATGTIAMHATFSGAGGTAAFLAQVDMDAATLPGSSGLSATAQTYVFAQAQFGGSGGLIPYLADRFVTSASLPGVSGWSAFVTERAVATAKLVGTSDGDFESGTGTKLRVGAEFDGTGAVLAGMFGGRGTQTDNAAVFAGTSSLFAAGPGTKVAGYATFAGAGNVYADIFYRALGAVGANLPGVGSFASAERAIYRDQGFRGAGAGALSGAVTTVKPTMTAAFAAVGGLSAFITRQQPTSSAALAGQSTFLGAPTPVVVSARFSGTSSFGALTSGIKPVISASFAGTSTFSAVVGRQVELLTTTKLSGSGALLAWIPQKLTATLPGAGTLSVGYYEVGVITAKLSGASTMVPDVHKDHSFPTVAFAGSSTMAATPRQACTGSVSLAGAGALSGSTARRSTVGGTLSGSSSLFAAPRSNRITSAYLAGTGRVRADDGNIRSATAQLVGSSSALFSAHHLADVLPANDYEEIIGRSRIPTLRGHTARPPTILGRRRQIV
jgi:hypothetical protein